MAWKNESRRHALSAKGLKSGRKQNLKKIRVEEKEIEYWDSNCVDNFEKYHRDLTKTEIQQLLEIREEIFNPDTPEKNIPNLYFSAIDILHNAWCRKHPDKKCILRNRTEKEEAEGIGFYGVSEAR